MSASVRTHEYSPPGPEISVANDYFGQVLQARRVLTLAADQRLQPPRLQSSIRVNHAKVDYTVTSFTPLEEANDVDVLAPGFCGTESNYLDAAAEMAHQGRTVVTFNPARHQGVHSFSPYNLFHPEGLLSKSLIGIMQDVHKKRHGIGTTDTTHFHLKPHSMAGLAGIEAAEQLGEQDSGPKVDTLTLVDAAGFTDHTLFSVLLGFPGVAAEFTQASIRHPELLLQAAAYLLTNASRSIGEGYGASSRKIPIERLDDLRQLGVRTGAYYHLRDTLFPGTVAEQRIGEAVDKFHLGKVGGHLAIVNYPVQTAKDFSDIDTALAA
jgi:hypothetical protein